jgi:hypothetical protein
MPLRNSRLAKESMAVIKPPALELETLTVVL